MHSNLPESQPEPTTSELGAELPPPRLRQRLSKRLAALSAVGAMMVVLPLVQVLRYQNAELRSLAAERAGLDPVTRAVEVQRGLLAHRELASLVLAGRGSFEAERKVRQGEVDDRVTALALALAAGSWERAIHESDALREDWALLSRQIDAHALSAGESDQAHRLLVEQSLQVVDLITAAVSPRGAAGRESVQPTLAVAHALPRLAWQTARLATLGTQVEPAERDRALANAEARLARTLGALNATLEQQPNTVLADASAAAGAATDRYFQALRHGGDANVDTATGREALASAALNAQFALFSTVHGDAARQLAGELATVQDQRNGMLAALGALALLAAAVLAGLLRQMRALPDGTERPSAARREHAETQRLLQRLRQPGDDTVTAAAPARPEPRPTLPGRL